PGAVYFAVLEPGAVFRLLEHVGGTLLGLGFDLVGRLHQRRDANRARARAVGAHAELYLVGVAVHDAHILDRQAEPLRHDLRERCLVALPMLVTAGEDLDRTRWVDAHFGGLPQAHPGPERAHRG